MIQVPPHIQAMMDAYVAETGVPIVLNYARASALTAISLLPPEAGGEPFGAEDVTRVLREIKRLQASGKGGVGEASLDFRNCLLNTDTFEERARKLRQRRGRMRGIPRTVDTARTLPDGRMQHVQAPEAPAEPLLANPAAALRALANDIGARRPSTIHPSPSTLR